MNQLQVRCPSCAKLYQVDVTAIFSTSPHFQCMSCPTRFTFDFPPADPLHVVTHAVETQSPASVSPATRKCPRCGAESRASAKECSSCQVIFEKLEGLPSDPSLRAQPSLVRRWKELLEDYTNEDKHHDFVMACQQLDALEYARHQYENIRQIQGQDEIATRQLSRLEAMKSVAPPPPVRMPVRKPGDVLAKKEPAPEHVPLPQWRKALLAAPFVVSLAMILWGMMHTNHRNMVGSGIAIALLSYGLIVSLRGRLTLRDFWE
ncbi:MAG: hypothetical protein KF865_14905 [Bdellovibrionaceae bacterium]|nr:hypothetical protein [Pseudobdellovibrionaceae bacterium]